MEKLRFILLDCKGAVEGLVDTAAVELYDGACPKPESRLINLIWNDFVSFDLNVFRVQSGTSLTFKCKVAVFDDDADMPTACTSKSTRRGRQNEETGQSGEVSVTINIAADDEEDDETDTVTITDSGNTSGYTPSGNIIIWIFSIIVLAA